MTAIEALAESWASIDGKLDKFHTDKGKPLAEGEGYYAGYTEEAEEMIRRLAKRGYRIVPA
jgi:hypothetical protein